MQLLSRLKIRTKLAGIVVLAALTALAIIAASASLSRSRMIEDRVAQMREGVTLLMGVAQSLQEEVEAGKLTLADAQAQFKQLGHHMSLDNGLGYPFAYLPGGMVLLNSGNPKLEGAVSNTRNSDGTLVSDLLFAAAGRRRGGLRLSSSRRDRSGSQDGVCASLCALESRSKLRDLHKRC